MAQALALAAVALCYFAALLVTRFHIQHVDFWGLWFIADHLDVREPASWYNRFYPVAFPIWIRATSFGHPIIAQSLATLGFALVTLAAVGQLARRTLGERWAVAMVLLVAAFRHSSTTRFQPAATPGLWRCSRPPRGCFSPMTSLDDGG